MNVVPPRTDSYVIRYHFQVLIIWVTAYSSLCCTLILTQIKTEDLRPPIPPCAMISSAMEILLRVFRFLHMQDECRMPPYICTYCTKVWHSEKFQACLKSGTDHSRLKFTCTLDQSWLFWSQTKSECPQLEVLWSSSINFVEVCHSLLLIKQL